MIWICSFTDNTFNLLFLFKAWILLDDDTSSILWLEPTSEMIGASKKWQSQQHNLSGLRSRRKWKNYRAVLRVSILAQFFCTLNLLKGFMGNYRLLMKKPRHIYPRFLLDLCKVYSRFIPDLFKVNSQFIPALFKAYPRFIPDLFMVYSRFIPNLFMFFSWFIHGLFNLSFNWRVVWFPVSP